MDRKILLVGLMSFLLIGAVGISVLLFSKPASFRGTTYAEPYPVAPEFELTRANGNTFQLSEQRGKIVMLFFGYTSCPDVCPTTMAELNQALRELGSQADQVQVIFVTVDPQRDTPERVQEYVNHFNPSFIGLSGSEAELAKVWGDYGVFREVVEGKSAAGYLVDHTARVTLIDQQGNLRVSFPFDTPVEDIVHDVELLLK
ncbi:MAG TPA: SCO family protein [Anaerolineales bacterium]|nr:SCO family protein [Anaerolineales bacterium]